MSNYSLVKYFFVFFFALLCVRAQSQQIDSIYVNLYTDSLKKGTFNYINIDGKLANGQYLPLDSSHVIFSASDGVFHGNSLWVEPDFSKEKITIKAVLRSNHKLCRQFDMYIKKKPDPVRLKTEEEILRDMRGSKKKRG